MKIGLDVMGGDFAPDSTLAGAVLARKEISEQDQLVLFGKKDIIIAKLFELGENPEHFQIVDAPDVIEMAEHPTKAFSQKTGSSIVIGFQYLKAGKIDSFSSAGNTGAMVVGSVYAMKVIDGIRRPCILTTVPKESGKVGILLDVGTNPDCKPEDLYQFAIIGSVFARNVMNIADPKVGLLNIGEEEEKGNIACQTTFKMMKNSEDFNFIGNVESRDLFKDKVDVLVTDGFTGNMVLKTVETMYRMAVKKGLKDDFFNRMNYENYGGTPVLGIDATVMIGHGISNDIAIKNMLLLSKNVFKAGLPGLIKTALGNYIRKTNSED